MEHRAWTVAFAAWLAVVIEAEVPSILHDFLAKFVRYSTHVNAYVFLGARAIRASVEGRATRWTSRSLRLHGVPGAAGSGCCSPCPPSSSPPLDGRARSRAVAFGFGLVGTTAFLGWFAALVSGRLPRGLR